MIKVLITGDFAPKFRVEEAILNGDYSSLFDEVKPLIVGADYSITNMEAPLIDKGEPIEKTGPNLKAPTKSIQALKYAGFNMVTLANNHIMDYGSEGLFSTMRLCRENGIEYIGAGKNVEEAKNIKYITIKDKRIAFINVAENEWSTTQGDKPGANPLNEVSVYYQITEAKQQADYAIVIIHGGHEMYEFPSPRMKKLYRWFVDLGADAVIGHHTHCFSGDEVYMGKPIVYSLGNFIFDHRNSRDSTWNRCAVAVLSLSEEGIGIELVPLHQCGDMMGVHLMSKLERNDFDRERSRKNMIIADDELLNAEFDKFIKRSYKLYASYLEPTNNKYVLALMNRKILPRNVKGKYKLLLHNLVRAEAHRDVIMAVLGGVDV